MVRNTSAQKTQLPFYDEVRVLDLRQPDSMPKDIKQYPNLLTPAHMMMDVDGAFCFIYIFIELPQERAVGAQA